MPLPNFLCIGATKAGTTWLNAQLDSRPDVLMPVVKELHYFSALHTPGHREWAQHTVTKAFNRALRHARRRMEEGDAGAKPVVKHLRRVLQADMFSEAWYRECFERPDREPAVCGEITPAYAELTEEGIDYVMSFLPGVRIIHILRHPMDRALSHLRMAVHRRNVEATEPALMTMLAGNPQILSRGRYEDQIPRWRSRVPADRLMIVPFGEVHKEPLQLLRRVEQFIGAKPYDHYPLSDTVNSTRRIEVPDAVVEHLKEQVRPTIEFLRAEFGDAFVESTH